MLKISVRKTGMANGPSKTMGLAKFSPNFTGLAVSIFLTRLPRNLVFFSRLRKSRSTDLFIFFLVKLNDITTSQNLKVLSSHSKHFEVSVSQLKKSKCLGLAKKNANLVVSQVSHLLFATPHNDRPVNIKTFLASLYRKISFNLRTRNLDC